MGLASAIGGLGKRIVEEYAGYGHYDHGSAAADPEGMWLN
jgi:hypothetical protein